MNRSWLSLFLLLVALLLSACNGEAGTLAVLQTPAAEAYLPLETPTRELEVVTPTPGGAPTRLPPIDLTNMTGDSWLSISPDGNWTAQIQVAYPFDKSGGSTGDRYYVRLEVLRKDGQVIWTVLDEWDDWGMGYTIPADLHWREDSLRLYYTAQAVADGCAVFGQRSGLYEVNLENGEVAEISESAIGELRASPDGKRIAVLSGETLEVRARDGVQTVQLKLDILAGEWQAGKLLWSPDGERLLFTVLFDPCGPPDRSSIYRLDVADGNLVPLVEEDRRVLVAGKWLSNETAELIDAAGAIWRIDVLTRNLRLVE